MDYIVHFPFWDFRSVLDTNLYETIWHRVEVKDKILREIVKNQLKVTDRILVQGSLTYKKADLEDGGHVYQGSILARTIDHLQDFYKTSREEAENVQETDTNLSQ